MISLIIPVYNEENMIHEYLPQLQWLRQDGHEVIVVDGNSDDHSRVISEPYADKMLVANKGRASQMNAGAAQASGEMLLFLHIDTLIDKEAIRSLSPKPGDNIPVWGRFDVQLSGKNTMFRVIEYMMNLRSRLSGIATGDQAMFIQRDLFLSLGGFSEIPLMEDIEISRRLKRICRPLCLSSRVITSSRRWEQNGIARTMFTMWILRLAYWLGVRPQYLARYYYRS